MQEILLSVVHKQECSEDTVDCVHSFYGDEFCKVRLKDQLRLLPTMATDHGYNLPSKTIADFIRFIQSLSAAERHFLSEVATLTKIMLLAPATNAVCEHSFSSLKRLKAYLRSTMGDNRLFHLMVLHVHKQLTDSLDLIQVVNRFVAKMKVKSRCSEHLANVTCQ